MIGERFNMLTVLEKAEPSHRMSRYTCKCDCGNTTTVFSRSLKSGHTKSCGCYRKTAGKALLFKHGHSYKPEYPVWSAMKNRCNNPNDASYKNYGGRGIKVCEEWYNYDNFIKDMGRRPEGKYTLERINNDGNYEPSNCKWATWKEQANNRRKREILSAPLKFHITLDRRITCNISKSRFTRRFTTK